MDRYIYYRLLIIKNKDTLPYVKLIYSKVTNVIKVPIAPEDINTKHGPVDLIVRATIYWCT